MAEYKDDDSDVEITGVEGENETVSFPHSRFDCTIFPLASNNPTLSCSFCYCFLCDLEVKHCFAWSSHCQATIQNKVWKNQVQAEIRQKNGIVEPVKKKGMDAFVTFFQQKPTTQSTIFKPLKLPEGFATISSQSLKQKEKKKKKALKHAQSSSIVAELSVFPHPALASSSSSSSLSYSSSAVQLINVIEGEENAYGSASLSLPNKSKGRLKKRPKREHRHQQSEATSADTYSADIASASASASSAPSPALAATVLDSALTPPVVVCSPRTGTARTTTNKTKLPRSLPPPPRPEEPGLVVVQTRTRTRVVKDGRRSDFEY